MHEARPSSESQRHPPSSAGATVVALHLNTGGRKPLTPVERVSVIAESGIEGDRHARPGRNRTVLLMEQEVLDQLGLKPGDVREQVTVQGLPLGRLAPDTRLRVGTAVLAMAEPCAPCERMNEIRRGLRTELEGRRGRFVRVIRAGSFAVGDSLVVEPPVG